jgi:hypothetical protein
MTRSRQAVGRVGTIAGWFNDSLFFLGLDTTTTGAENLLGGLHAAPVTGNDAVVAASALALRQFSNSCGVTKVKEKLGDAI